MKRTHLLGIGALVVTASAAGNWIASRVSREPFGSPALAQSSSPAPALPVQTTSPERRSVSRLIALPGDVRPWEEATLYAKVPGYLGSIAVDKGDRVRAGQILATIQAPELQAEREQAQHTYQSATAAAQGSRAASQRTSAELQRARITAEKTQADFAQTTVAIARAKAQLTAAEGAQQQAVAQKDQAVATLEESQAQVEKAKADLDGVRADQRLADVTYERYQGIYTRDPMLLAKQELDIAESRARAARSKTLSFQSAVDIAQRHVKASQALVRAAASQIQQAQAQVEAARDKVGLMAAQQTSAQKQLNIAVQDVAIGRKQQEVSRAKIEEVQSQANAGKSAVGKLTIIAEYARIRAPFNGIVTRRHADPGAFIQTASASQNAAPIVTVASMDRLRVVVNVPEAEAGFVKAGTPVVLTLMGKPDAPIKGRVTRTAGSLDSKTRTLLVEIDLPNREGAILTGTYAMVKVALETHPHVVCTPSGAVGSDRSGKFVYIVEGSKAKRVPITVGFDDGAYTEIVDGLKGRERVVVTGRDALTPNAAVNATAWSPATKLH